MEILRSFRELTSFFLLRPLALSSCEKRERSSDWKGFSFVLEKTRAGVAVGIRRKSSAREWNKSSWRGSTSVSLQQIRHDWGVIANFSTMKSFAVSSISDSFGNSSEMFELKFQSKAMAKMTRSVNPTITEIIVQQSSHD